MIATDNIPPAPGHTARPSRWTKLTFTDSSLFEGEGGPPLVMDTVEIFDGFAPAAGVYLLTGATGVGKTTTLAAIIAWARVNSFHAAHLTVFEPRSPNYTFRGSGSSSGGDTKRFTDPHAFLGDFKKGLPPVTAGSAKPRILVGIDSITLPMKAYAKTFDYQATFEGGMQPSDRGFLDKLSNDAVEHNLTIIAVVNVTLVPYVTALAGAVEGLIEILAPGRFRYHDRTAESARRNIEITMPTELTDKVIANIFK